MSNQDVVKEIQYLAFLLYPKFNEQLLHVEHYMIRYGYKDKPTYREKRYPNLEFNERYIRYYENFFFYTKIVC